MAINIAKSTGRSYSVRYSLQDPTGYRKDYEVSLDNSWDETTTGRKGEMFNVGGGSRYLSYPERNFSYGSHVFVPEEDFIGSVHVWGAGGGAYHNNGGRYAGGGGYSQALIRFVGGTPYTIVVGQAGKHNDNTATHGGGGRGHGNGGSGGGLSGIFMNSTHYGRNSWAHTTPPVTQAQALIIGGAGGGGGHHNQGSHYGNGGGGGGWWGKRAHTGNEGTQTGGGSAGYSNSSAGSALHGGHSSTNSNWVGGGGSGWWGGGGGGHSSNHHNGGNGGSGHIAYENLSNHTPASSGNAKYILNGFMEKAPGHFNNGDFRPANFENPLCMTEGRYAGQGGHGERQNGHGNTYGPRNGKVVITLMPEFLGQYQFPTHNSPNDSNGWTQDY
jgi:hypothetical protein